VKREYGAKNCLFPIPTVLVGALVEEKPNFNTIAFVGIIDLGHVSVTLNNAHYTNIGIKEKGTFSVNIPSTEMVIETDYCGLVSGSKVDKSSVFEVFYGKLETAPMIERCPLNMECRLAQTLEMANRDVFIGEIVMTYCDEGIMVGGKVDYADLHPLFFTMDDNGYWSLGERIATAWDAGKVMMK
jgi:flavin reductase (DIM6/NTAB) family NADH-FMN oxidoreductase RutF